MATEVVVVVVVLLLICFALLCVAAAAVVAVVFTGAFNVCLATTMRSLQATEANLHGGSACALLPYPDRRQKRSKTVHHLHCQVRELVVVMSRFPSASKR